jgi:hypothetical protein
MVVIIKINFFDVTPCSPDDVNRRFEVIFRIEYSESKNRTRKFTTLPPNVDEILHRYTALHPTC